MSRAGGEQIDVLLRAKRPLIAGAMLRPFFEAYEIVADVLRDAPAEIDEKELTKRALGVGRQYVAQDRVRSNECGVGAAVRDRAAGRRPTSICSNPLPTWTSGGRRFLRRTSRRHARHGQGRADRPRAVLRPRDGAAQPCAASPHNLEACGQLAPRHTLGT